MRINQTDFYPDLIKSGYSPEESYYYANQMYSEWSDRTKLSNN